MIRIARIETYLNEDEVTEQVSSLKGEQSQQTVSLNVFGFQNASFQWNSIKEAENPKAKPTAASEDGHSETASTLTEGTNTFELKDVSLVFPERILTLVTGPTASGKSALLVRFPDLMFWFF